ncbi:helix-turn-helix domain-containing protein [Mesorhizobium australicum]|uniref:Helix-turn-helix domain-containing protein n=1 Tax=Mesorhizobium australicum TaxID=536018 RepID=A0ACC6T0G1_9HYPH
MSYEIIKWARERALPAGPKSLLRLLADFANKKGECWPGQQRLARELGRGERSVRRWLDELERDHFIRRAPRYHSDGSGGRNSDFIVLCFWNTRLPAMVAAKSKATEAYRPTATGLAANHDSLPATVAGESPENLPDKPPERGAGRAQEGDIRIEIRSPGWAMWIARIRRRMGDAIAAGVQERGWVWVPSEFPPDEVDGALRATG